MVILGIVRPKMVQLPAAASKLGGDDPETMAFCAKLPALRMVQLGLKLLAEIQADTGDTVSFENEEIVKTMFPESAVSILTEAGRDRNMAGEFEAAVGCIRGKIGQLNALHESGIAVVELCATPGGPPQCALAFASGAQEALELVAMIDELKGRAPGENS